MRHLFGSIALLTVCLNSALALADSRSCKFTDQTSIEAQVHYNLDKFSPYALAKYESSDTMAKINNNTLESLLILQTDVLWMYINLELGVCGINSVSKRNQSAAITAGDVLILVNAKLQGAPHATMTRSYNSARNRSDGVVQETIEIEVD